MRLQEVAGSLQLGAERIRCLRALVWGELEKGTIASELPEAEDAAAVLATSRQLADAMVRLANSIESKRSAKQSARRRQAV